jgi:hypothetical protein
MNHAMIVAESERRNLSDMKSAALGSLEFGMLSSVIKS